MKNLNSDERKVSDDDSASSSSDDSDEYDENNNLKLGKKINFKKMIKYHETMSNEDSNDDEEDDDSNDDDDYDSDYARHTPNDKTGYDMRLEYIRAKYFPDLSQATNRIQNENLMSDIDLLHGIEAVNDENDSAAAYFYERVGTQRLECLICCDEAYLNERECCQFKACNSCINLYIQTQIKQCCGVVRLECINAKCGKLMHRDEISERMARFDKETLHIYLKFLVEANKDSNCNFRSFEI